MFSKAFCCFVTHDPNLGRDFATHKITVPQQLANVRGGAANDCGSFIDADRVGDFFLLIHDDHVRIIFDDASFRKPAAATRRRRSRHKTYPQGYSNNSVYPFTATDRY